MNIFNILSLLGGLALFLYGMDVMGEGLKKLSGGKLEAILQRMTSNPCKGVLLGLLVTAIIQSSSATTVMVVGFVNSGIMQLSQATGVIMGANIGTTVTSWLLSLTGIQGNNTIIQLLEPASFSPLLAFVGIILIMFCKNEKRNDFGSILIGFAVLMTGMMSMSGAVAPLADVPEFAKLMTMFSNPILGLIAGTVLTAIIQSSSASVGILQALCATGSIHYSVALPVIMGQNIGTCITAILSALGANRNSKRTALIHLFFNLIGTSIFMVVFYATNTFVRFDFLSQAADEKGIAIIHSCFNMGATLLLLPFSNLLVKLAYIALPMKEDEKENKENCLELLDVRFMEKPVFALAQAKTVCNNIVENIYDYALQTKKIIYDYKEINYSKLKTKQEDMENELDCLNDYLVQLSNYSLSHKDNQDIGVLLQETGELKGILTQLYQIVKVSKKLHKKEGKFSKTAKEELEKMWDELHVILEFIRDVSAGEDEKETDRLYAKVRDLKRQLKKSKKNHIERLQKGDCSANVGMAFLDILSGYEQIMFCCKEIWEVKKGKVR